MTNKIFWIGPIDENIIQIINQYNKYNIIYRKDVICNKEYYLTQMYQYFCVIVNGNTNDYNVLLEVGAAIGSSIKLIMLNNDYNYKEIKEHLSIFSSKGGIIYAKDSNIMDKLDPLYENIFNTSKLLTNLTTAGIDLLKSKYL